MADLNDKLTSVKSGDADEVEHDFDDGSVLRVRRNDDEVEIFVELIDVERESSPQLFEMLLADKRPETAKRVQSAVEAVFGESREFTSTRTSIPPVYDTRPLSASATCD